jgi:hypothetical protein
MNELQARGSQGVGETFLPNPPVSPSTIQSPQPPLSQGGIPKIELRESTTDSTIAYAIVLLRHYGFELRGYTPEELVSLWLKGHPAHWVRLAVIEALYQGRYKAISVEQILAVWTRRGQPIHRFTHEFERLISRKLPQNLAAPLNQALTYLPREQSLPLYPDVLEPVSTIPDIIDEWEARSPEDEPISSAPVLQEIPPPPAPVLEEAIETAVHSDELLCEEPSNQSTNPTYEANWSRCETKKQPIHQFTPPPDVSGFYLKLKAVAQQKDDIPPKFVAPAIDGIEQESEPPQLLD